MNLFLGSGLIALALALVLIGRAQADGTPKRFLGNELVALIYPVLILAAFAAGVGAILG